MRRLLAILFALPLLWLAACADGGTEAECSEEVACEGFGEVCLDGQCVVGSCNSNLDCPMEQVCDGRTCTPGCSSDNDCFPEDACNLEVGQCEPRGCTDTHLDCGYKEFCNALTGECYDAGGVYCRPCSSRNVAEDCNSGDDDGTNQCWNNYCTVDCSDGRECPSGFQCYPFTDRAGNVLTWQCLTYCWLYEDAQSGARLPAPPMSPLPLEPTAPAESLLPAPAEGR